MGLAVTTCCPPLKIPNLENIVAAAAAGSNVSSIFLDLYGNVFTCGNNQYGQLGHGDKINRNLPQQVMNIPRIRNLKIANYTNYFFVVVDTDVK